MASLMRQKTLDALKSHTGFPHRQVEGKKPRLVFTGHSAGLDPSVCCRTLDPWLLTDMRYMCAGGAVAALLWSCCVGNKRLQQQAGNTSVFPTRAFSNPRIVALAKPRHRRFLTVY